MPEKESRQYSYEETTMVGTVDHLLKLAVQKQLESDVPLGLFLSGGLSSTLLLAIMHELGRTGIDTYTIAPKDDRKMTITETGEYAVKAAEKYGAKTHILEVDSKLLNDFEAFVSCIDQPIGDSSMLLQYHLSQFAGSAINVGVSGEAGDSLFAGDIRHSVYYKYLYFRQKWPFLLWMMKQQALMPIMWGDSLERHRAKEIVKLFRTASKDPHQTYFNFLSLPGFLDKPIRNADMKGIEPIASLEDALRYDRANTLISGPLKYTDFIPMQFGIEVRLPFTDRELVDYMSSINKEDLVKYGRKWILKRILSKKGGAFFAERPVEKWRMPAIWLNSEEGKGVLSELLNNSNPLYKYLSYSKVAPFLEAHQNQTSNYGKELWSIAVLAHWMKQHFM